MVRMALPLADDEEVQLALRPHWKALVVPAATLIVTAGFASFLIALLPGGKDQAPARLVVGVLATVVVLVWSVRPFLQWRSTAFVLTNRRLIVREGMFSRHGHDLLLSRVHDVSFSHTLWERIVGCGTLVVDSAGEHEPLEVTEVPRVEKVQAELYRLVEHSEHDEQDREEPPT